jgi:hypothetical protein
MNQQPELFQDQKIIKASYTKDSAQDILDRIGVKRVKEKGKPTTWEFEGRTKQETNNTITRFEEVVEQFTGYKIVYE